MKIIKRSGEKVNLDYSKIHEAVAWACADIPDVSQSQLELNAKLAFYDGMHTSDIQNTLIKSAADLITAETPDYQYVASKLIIWQLYKEAYDNGLVPPRLYDHVRNIVSLGFYEPELLNWYTEEEWDILDGYVDHSRDKTIAYAGMDLWRTKYLVRDRVSGKIFETPQVALILIAATFFHRYDKKERLKWVKDFYDATSQFEINLPTPIMAGIRTPEKQFSSCVLIESADSLDSIFATSTAIGQYIAKRAGIGIGGQRIRAVGSKVRNGDTSHTGVIPFYKLWEAAVGSCSQGGVRKGSGTLNYVGWHLEFKDLVVLKNNKGTEDTRIRKLDYCVQLNRLFYERLINDGNITLFSPSDVPGLLDAFYADFEKFKTLYEKYEKNPKIRKETISAVDYFNILMQERKDTGRIYIMNVDHANDHGAFIPELAPITMTNLCTEINVPTFPITSNPEEGEIGLCTLSAVNAGVVKIKDLERVSRLIVRALNELLDYQDYAHPAAERAGRNRRTLGIGLTGLAHLMAKLNIPYSTATQEQLERLDEYFEAFSFHMIKASMELARERDHPCEWFSQTKYSGSVLPIDTYNRNVDQIVPHKERMDWGWLRDQISHYGMYNSTLMTQMPVETSALASNSTNGIEPPRALVSQKGDTKQVVPDIKKLKNRYEPLWDQKSPEGYLKIVALLQKYTDQAISVNVSYNPEYWPNENPDLHQKIPMTVMIDDLIFAFMYGLKTLYYNQTNDLAGEVKIEQEIDEENCESCVL